MSTNLPENNEEFQLPAPEAQADLPAGPAEAKKIADPVADLKREETHIGAIEYMVSQDQIVKPDGNGGFEPIDPANKTAIDLVSFFDIMMRRFNDKENAKKTHNTHATESRKDIKKVVDAPKPKTKEHPKAKHEKAQHEKAPELILIDPNEYHKLDLLKEENKPLPQSRLFEAAKSIILPYDQNAIFAALDALVLARTEALVKQINQHVEHIKTVHTFARLNEITDTLVKQGLLIRRGRDLVANPNSSSTIALENAVKSKEKEIEVFMKEYNETANDPAGLEITIEKSRRVGKETKTYSDRYAVRFVFGKDSKTIRLAKIMKRHPNSENLNLDTNRSYTQDNLPKWLEDKYVEIKNGQISLKKEAPKEQRQEPLMKIKRQPAAQGPASTENTKNVSAPEVNKDPLAESVAHLNQLTMAHPELKIITKSFKALRGKDEKPETLHPSLTAEKLDEILRDAFDLKEGQPTPKSLLDLATISKEWEAKDLLVDLTGIAGSIQESIKELQKEAAVAKPEQEKAA